MPAIVKVDRARRQIQARRHRRRRTRRSPIGGADDAATVTALTIHARIAVVTLAVVLAASALTHRVTCLTRSACWRPRSCRR
jgi:hypothetical protein